MGGHPPLFGKTKLQQQAKGRGSSLDVLQQDRVMKSGYVFHNKVVELFVAAEERFDQHSDQLDQHLAVVRGILVELVKPLADPLHHLILSGASQLGSQLNLPQQHFTRAGLGPLTAHPLHCLSHSHSLPL